MTPAPGTIGAVFDDIIPPTRDSDPVTAQEESEFKEVVAQVARSFAELEAGRAGSAKTDG
jgi:hypothetical protein